MEQILLPTTIEFVDSDQPNAGQVIVTPCHQGYGTTLGNSLRRVLLSSLPGAAVESVKIRGVQHEFSAISGVQEDVVEVLLNLKQMAVRCFADNPITLTLTKKGKGDVTVGDFEKNSDVEIVNPDLKIATLTNKKGEFEQYSFDVTKEHLEELKKEINTCAEDVLSMEFLKKGCNKKDCEWCQFER